MGRFIFIVTLASVIFSRRWRLKILLSSSFFFLERNCQIFSSLQLQKCIWENKSFLTTMNTNDNDDYFDYFDSAAVSAWFVFCLCSWQILRRQPATFYDEMIDFDYGPAVKFVSLIKLTMGTSLWKRYISKWAKQCTIYYYYYYSCPLLHNYPQ